MKAKNIFRTSILEMERHWCTHATSTINNTVQYMYTLYIIRLGNKRLPLNISAYNSTTYSLIYYKRDHALIF